MLQVRLNISTLVALPPSHTPSGELSMRNTFSTMADIHVSNYPNACFTNSIKEYHTWMGRWYGTGYKNCLTERFIMSVCINLGVHFGVSHILPANIDGFIITYKQVCQWAVVSVSSFMTLQSYFKQARKAQDALFHASREGRVLGIAHATMLQILQAMLGKEVLLLLRTARSITSE